MNDARIIAAFNGNIVWFFKTDVYKIANVRKLIKYHFPEYTKIQEFTFDNETLAHRRSCNTKLSGWKVTKMQFMQYMEKYKATTIKSYSI